MWHTLTLSFLNGHVSRWHTWVERGPSVTWSQTADIFFLEIVTASSHVEGSCWRRQRRQTPADTHHVLREKGIIRSAVTAVLMALYVVSMSTVYKVLTCILQCSLYFSKKTQNICSLFNLLTWGVHLLLSEYFTSVSEWSCYMRVPVAGNDSDNYDWELLEEHIFLKLNHWKAFSEGKINPAQLDVLKKWMFLVDNTFLSFFKVMVLEII